MEFLAMMHLYDMAINSFILPMSGKVGICKTNATAFLTIVVNEVDG